MNTVRLIAKTIPVSEEFLSSFDSPLATQEMISYCARVSNPSNQDNRDTSEKLLKYCIKHKHWSVFEMGNIVLEINTTRDISRQILRHRSFHFQEFCVSGDTKITTKTKAGRSKKIPISKLYDRWCSDQYWNMSDNLIKVFDRSKGVFVDSKIKEVFDRGVNGVYRMTLDNGKTIECTKNHKILTFDGFKALKDVVVSDFVAVNGIPKYQDRDWLTGAKEVSIQSKTGLFGIANMAGVSSHTIRKWLKKHNLTFSKKETRACFPVWNKGLPAENQPMYGKYHPLSVRNKQRKSSRQSIKSNLYTGGDQETWRHYVARWCFGFKNELIKKQNGLCTITGKPLVDPQVDHIEPVCFRPDLAFDVNNLQVISKSEHIKKTKQEKLLSNETASFSKVVEITYIGEKHTYDLEVEHQDHNYIANGIVTHNSQRYADVNELGFVRRKARYQDTKNRQNSIKLDEQTQQDNILIKEFRNAQDRVLQVVQEEYERMLNFGIAKEQARVLLPEGLTSSRIYANATVRDWFHYCQLRMGPETQLEHREIATECWKHVVAVCPFLSDVEVVQA